MTKQELAERIRAASYKEGDFLLRSGRRSTFYVDKYLFETQPDILAEVGKLLATHVDKTTTRIAGAELGGVPLAAATSMASGKPFVIVRNAKKDYGTTKMFEGAIEKGDRVLLVEDIATTGGQVLEAAKVLSDAGAVVQRIVAVVDRAEGAADNIRKAGHEFAALFTGKDLRIPGAAY
ncbi:MAG: orotate phosphoribosyltransferase [Planctomycetes bacterium]|nr:orotate phosphoribosyltransferase [Planctomycetota bacterium]